jgi:hypothetical protein
MIRHRICDRNHLAVGLPANSELPERAPSLARSTRTRSLAAHCVPPACLGGSTPLRARDGSRSATIGPIRAMAAAT